MLVSFSVLMPSHHSWNFANSVDVGFQLLHLFGSFGDARFLFRPHAVAPLMELCKLGCLRNLVSLAFGNHTIKHFDKFLEGGDIASLSIMPSGTGNAYSSIHGHCQHHGCSKEHEVAAHRHWRVQRKSCQDYLRSRGEV